MWLRFWRNWSAWSSAKANRTRGVGWSRQYSTEQRTGADKGQFVLDCNYLAGRGYQAVAPMPTGRMPVLVTRLARPSPSPSQNTA